VLLTESKIAWACMLLGYAVVFLWWAVAHRRWKMLAAVVAASLPLLYLAFHFIAYRRLDLFLVELDLFLDDGTLTADSFGWRYELATSGLRAFWENPLLGYGLVERMSVVMLHASPGGPDISFLAHLHNDYVTHLVAYGLPGILFVAAFLLFAYYLAARCPDAGIRRAGVAMALLLALYMVFEVAFNMDAISGPVTVAIGILMLKPWAGAAKRRDAAS
jgi:O-antigen ligase